MLIKIISSEYHLIKLDQELTINDDLKTKFMKFTNKNNDLYFF